MFLQAVTADVDSLELMETSTESTGTTDLGRLIAPVLADLADVMAGIGPDRFAAPTPCAEFDVAELRRHVLGWVTFFAAAVTDPDGNRERPDPSTFVAPDDPHAAANVIRAAAAAIAAAVTDGVTDRPVLMVQATMPGSSILRMALWEYLTHGSDLARATGQPWNPPAAAGADALAFAPMMLTDEYRGPGKDFGPQVPVPDDAPVLDRLLGFSGRDPHWTA